MSKIALADFFKWFDETNVNHLEAVVLLESMMDPKLLRDASAWVRKYREPLPEPEAPPWPITKEQLGYIMQCSSETLNDALINDLAKCVADCEMDQLELVYFLANAAMNQLASATRLRSTTAAITSSEMTSGTRRPAGGSSTPGLDGSRSQVLIGTGSSASTLATPRSSNWARLTPPKNTLGALLLSGGNRTA